MAAVVWARGDFVHNQIVGIADHKHFHRQHAHIVQLVGQTARHLLRLLLHVGAQAGGDDGIGKNAVFMDVFSGVEGLYVFAIQTAHNHRNLAAQIHHFFQYAIYAAVCSKRGFEFVQAFHPDLAFAVVTQRGGFQNAGQQGGACFADVFRFANSLIRRGLQTGFLYPRFFLNAVLRNRHAVAAG